MEGADISAAVWRIWRRISPRILPGIPRGDTGEGAEDSSGDPPVEPLHIELEGAGWGESRLKNPQGFHKGRARGGFSRGPKIPLDIPRLVTACCLTRNPQESSPASPREGS